MEKAVYERPSMQLELFQANDSVSTCYGRGKYSFMCALPGDATNKVNDGHTLFVDRNYDADGHSHDTCGRFSEAGFENNKLYETTVGGITATWKQLYNIVFGDFICDSTSDAWKTTEYTDFTGGTSVLDQPTNGYYHAKWDVDFNNETYHHYGVAYLEGAQTGVNHS